MIRRAPDKIRGSKRLERKQNAELLNYFGAQKDQSCLKKTKTKTRNS